MAWSKFSPREAPRPPLGASSPEAGRRAWLLKWGWWVSQGMFYLGLLLLVYWLFRS
ncbi:MAG: hypothetical protein ABR562_01160 [Thermoplasmatota archaeon]